MECNKDEATKAKEIAESKFAAKDIYGAMRFALKAQHLYPDLEGIPQMITTFDVYIAAKNRINGEANLYCILGVDPLVDDDILRKQYRKLALILHPDKNKSIGADGGLNLISRAWSLLSDKTQWVAYDAKIIAKSRKVSTEVGSSSAHTGANFNYNFTKTTTSGARTQNTTAKEHASTSSHKPKAHSFWTVCHRCKVRYEYLRVYLNLKLRCRYCREPFLAVETAPPTAGFKSATSCNFSQDQQNCYHQGPGKSKSSTEKNLASPNIGAGSYSKYDSYNPTNLQWTPFSRTSGVSSAGLAANVVQQAYEKVK